MELCKSYYGLLLISLIYFQNEVTGKICKQNIESPYGSVQEIHPRALTDKCPNKSDGVSRYRDLYDLIAETIYRKSINTESVSFHQNIKVDSEYKLPRITRRHLNMAIEGEKEELKDLANLENEKFILVRSKHDTISLSHNDASFTSHFKMRISTENFPESSTVTEKNDEETEFTLNVAKENDSIQKSKNIIDTKQTSLFRILFTRDPNRYLLKRKRDDNYYFIRLQNSVVGNRKRQQTLDPFWPRATQFTKRRKTAQPYNPFTMQNRRTKTPAWTHYSPKERIPKRKRKNKSHFKAISKFKYFSPSAEKKVPILFADLSHKNIGKISGGEYHENADTVRITLGERMEGVLPEDKREEIAESSFSTSQPLSKENIAQENLEFTETHNSSPPDQTTEVKDAAGAKPESIKVGSSSLREQPTDKISTQSSESTATDNNSPTDHLNEDEDKTETQSESIKSKDNATLIDQSNSTENAHTENSKSTETGNSLSTDQTAVFPDTFEANTESTETNSNSSVELSTDNTSAESREIDNSSPTERNSEKESTFETKSENSSSTDQSNSKEKTSVENWESTEAGKILPINKTTRAGNTSETNSEKIAADNISSGALTVDKITTESLETIQVNTTESAERIYRGYEANSSLRDQFNSKESTSADNLESTKAGNSLPTNQTSREGNTFQTNTELIKAESIPERMAANNTSTESLESIKANATAANYIINEDYGANSSVTDQFNSKENTSAEISESKEAPNSLLTNQITRDINTSETNLKLIETDNSSLGARTSDNSFVESSESIMVNNTTEFSERIYRGYEANSSLTDQFSSKANTSSDNLESVEVDKNILTNQSTTVGNTSQTSSKSITVESNFTRRMAADNTSTGSIESMKFNTTEATERIYRGYKANSSLTDRSNNKGITSTENSQSKYVGNSVHTNQTTEVGNMSEKKPESTQEVNSFLERLVTGNNSEESLESNATQSIEKIYRGYGVNGSLTFEFDNKGNTSADNHESTEAGNNLTTNQGTRVGNTSQRNLESINAGSTFPEKLSAGNTSTESLESIKTNIAETTERIYSGYEVNSSLIGTSNNKENTYEENSESTENGNSLPTNQTTRIRNASETNAELIEESKVFPGSLAADNSSVESSESIKTNTTESTGMINRGNEGNSSESREEDNSSNNKENTFIDSSEHIKTANSTPEMGNISSVADNSYSLGDKSSVAADNSFAEAGRSSPLGYDLHNISLSEHYLNKSSPLSPDRSASLDKENLKSPNAQA